MKAKKILDIRLFEESVNGKSLPSYAGRTYEVRKEEHFISTRMARKLREMEFITGDFDHVYIVMTPELEEHMIAENQRGTEKWMKYVDVGVPISDFNGKTRQQKEEYMLELISRVLRSIAMNDEQREQVNHVQREITQRGSELEIGHISKETSKYVVKIVYQICPWNNKSRAIVEYHDLVQRETRKSVFLELNMYEDLFYLASSITVKDGSIYLKPRSSQTASYHIQSYETPICIQISDIPFKN